MYEDRDIADIKEWINQLMKRGYFVVVVRLINRQRLMDWCATN